MVSWLTWKIVLIDSPGKLSSCLFYKIYEHRNVRKVLVVCILLEVFFGKKVDLKVLKNSKNWVSGIILFKLAGNCLLSSFLSCHHFLTKGYVESLILLAIYLLIMFLGCSNSRCLVKPEGNRIPSLTTLKITPNNFETCLLWFLICLWNVIWFREFGLNWHQYFSMTALFLLYLEDWLLGCCDEVYVILVSLFVFSFIIAICFYG